MVDKRGHILMDILIGTLLGGVVLLAMFSSISNVSILLKQSITYTDKYSEYVMIDQIIMSDIKNSNGEYTIGLDYFIINGNRYNINNDQLIRVTDGFEKVLGNGTFSAEKIIKNECNYLQLIKKDDENNNDIVVDYFLDYK